MSTYATDRKNGIDVESIERRDVRALTECMTVMEHAPEVAGADGLFLVVTQSGKTYTVDVLDEPRCTCPDAQYNLPTTDGRRTCKHASRVTYETGMRPIPAWVNRDALESQLLEATHVDGEPVFAAGRVAGDGNDVETDSDERGTTRRAIADGGCDRPADCCCVGELPCFMCWRAGFRTPADESAREADE
ncbi:SWIM zinc finger family protein [Natronosalvus rutilus]|uniref:SWIM zinc finger family protein n=1 Tax=Natronosalvus rutilus TaxID=2953753 RepID=A0A9E7ST40_9EURY|nr:SWIM zinc finger family protein [Natronosalvus rutilus]UTF53259.1 SWIM zinc finger family protein [Natronosalvus rutilus]